MVRFNGQQAQYWRTLFIKMQNAHDNCGVALREDLKTELDSTAQTFAALESRHQELRAQEKDLRKQAAAEQRKSAKILNRTRYALLSLTGKEKLPRSYWLMASIDAVPRAGSPFCTSSEKCRIPCCVSQQK